MRAIKFLLATIIITLVVSCAGKRATKKSLTNELDSISYAIGLDRGIKMRVNFEGVNPDFYVQGYLNGLDSTNILIHPKELNYILRTYFQERSKKESKAREAGMIKKLETDYAKNKKEGENFLEKNRTLKGINITDSGLQYLILKNGKGKKPNVNSTVKVNFTGSLIDGTIFQTTDTTNKPYITELNKLIKGWIEGVQLMNVGSKYKFFVPQELGYMFKSRMSGKIEPFSALIFEIELLEVVKQ